jgi:hypothetical protein
MVFRENRVIQNVPFSMSYQMNLELFHSPSEFLI